MLVMIRSSARHRCILVLHVLSRARARSYADAVVESGRESRDEKSGSYICTFPWGGTFAST
jgi:hypothetical protein